MVALIVWLSLTPSPPTLQFRWSDKWGHLLAYGGLMFWFCRLYTRPGQRLAYGFAWAAMGIGLEFVQGALGYRTFELLDMVANTLGVLAGWAFALATRRWRFPGNGPKVSKLR